MVDLLPLGGSTRKENPSIQWSWADQEKKLKKKPPKGKEGSVSVSMRFWRGYKVRKVVGGTCVPPDQRVEIIKRGGQGTRR